MSYGQVSGSNQQEEQEMAPGDVDRTVVAGLQEEEAYYVQVCANAVAGAGVRSRIVIVQPPSTTTGTGLPNTGAIIGGVVAIVIVVAITIIVVVIIVTVLVRGRRNGLTQDKYVLLIILLTTVAIANYLIILSTSKCRNNNSIELENKIPDTINEGVEYEMVKDVNEGKTGKI